MTLGPAAQVIMNTSLHDDAANHGTEQAEDQNSQGADGQGKYHQIHAAIAIDLQDDGGEAECYRAPQGEGKQPDQGIRSAYDEGISNLEIDHRLPRMISIWVFTELAMKQRSWAR